MKTEIPLKDLREIVDRSVDEAKQNSIPDARGYERGDATRLKKWRGRLRRWSAVKAWLDSIKSEIWTSY